MTPVQKQFLKVIVPVHLLFLFFILTLPINTTVLATFVISYILIYPLSYNMYHRYWAHRQFDMVPMWQKVFAVIGLFALTGDPIGYSSTHRIHHRYTDVDLDPHSPVHGFWHAFILWMFKPKNDTRQLLNVKDLLKDDFLMWLMKHQNKVVWGILIIAGIVSEYILFGLLTAMVAVFFLEMCSNSFLSHWGTHGPYNNYLYSYLSGSSLHVTHHENMIKISKNDPSRPLLLGMKKLKIISSIKCIEQ
jgi:stearoyl-CoA desaturase (delta-9 desaturase)